MFPVRHTPKVDVIPEVYSHTDKNLFLQAT